MAADPNRLTRSTGRPVHPILSLLPPVVSALGVLMVAYSLIRFVALALSLGLGQSQLFWLVGLSNLFGLGMVAAGYWAMNRRRSFSFSAFRWFLVFPMALMVGGGITVAVAANEFANLLIGAPDLLGVPNTALLYIRTSSNLGMVFALVLVAPLCEEFVFRGIILRGFLRRYSDGSAILISALLFAGFHFNPQQFLAPLVAGLLLGWLYVRFGSLLPCVLVHAMWNAVPASMSLLSIDIRKTEMPVWTYFLGVALLLGGALWLRAFSNRPGRMLTTFPIDELA